MASLKISSDRNADEGLVKKEKLPVFLMGQLRSFCKSLRSLGVFPERLPALRSSTEFGSFPRKTPALCWECAGEFKANIEGNFVKPF